MKQITKEELKHEMETGDVLVINVLPEKYYKKSHIKGSINIPINNEDFEAKVEAAGSKDKNTVVYCANYDCKASGDAFDKLTAAGFTNVRAYEGGTQEWEESGYPLGGVAE